MHILIAMYFINLDVVVTGICQVVIWVAGLLVIVVVLSFREPVPDQVRKVVLESNAHVLSRVRRLRVKFMTIQVGYIVALLSMLFSYSGKSVTPVLQNGQEDLL